MVKLWIDQRPGLKENVGKYKLQRRKEVDFTPWVPIMGNDEGVEMNAIKKIGLRAWAFTIPGFHVSVVGLPLEVPCRDGCVGRLTGRR